MIGIYKDRTAGGEDTRLAMTYRSLTINNDTYPVSIVVASHRFDSVTEPRAERDGMEAYVPRRMVTTYRIEGIVKADNIAQLHDRIDALNAAFDPILATDADPTDIDTGFLPFTFSVPTEDTDNYATGLIPMQIYGRSLELPVNRVSKFEGDGARFSILLQCADPRRYLQTNEELTIVGLSDTMDNSLSTYASWPIVTLTMSGAGSAAWYMDRNDDGWDHLPITIDLSGRSAGEVVVIDMDRKEILVDGVVDMSLYVSGHYFMAPASDTTLLSVPNQTGITSCVVTWARAFV